MKLVINTDLNYLENFILIKKDLLKKFGVDEKKMINNIFDILSFISNLIKFKNIYLHNNTLLYPNNKIILILSLNEKLL
jgi:hypothetical protein